MAALLRKMYFGYRYINEELSDPRTQDFFLIGSPWICISIIASYLYFVHELGPRIMANRKPFNLDRVVQVYNVAQILVCGFIFYKAIVLAWMVDYKFSCQPVDPAWTPRALEIARICWMYFIVKILDLLDTTFFILRKKESHVSFLHVYHHAGMVTGTWVAVKFLPGGHFIFLGTINSFVHVVMYSHYLATSLRISRPWWKKYVTQLQLAQFCLILVQFILLLCTEDCGFPKWTAVVMIPQNLFMLILFGDFYYRAYIRTPKGAKNGAATPLANGKPKRE